MTKLSDLGPPIIGRLQVRAAATERDYFHICPGMRAAIDRRDLRQVIWHEQPNPKPLEMEVNSRFFSGMRNKFSASKLDSLGYGDSAMLLALDDAITTAVLAGRGADAAIFGVIDLTSKIETRIGAISLGRAIQFVANASVLGYDMRDAMVLYGEPGTPSLRVWDCERLWAQYGGALLQS
ncbi:hypothetical protein [Mesorhizobium sp.]|uniref:hypothetical protein n=1 Tax=Mesorhizobium sp. TaxID=1871066 RepID=UPI0025C63C91|nr:hypothetical protein [Mesorhizobium sp.]